MQKLENKIPPPLVAALFALVMWAVAAYLPAIEIHLLTRILLSMAAFASGAFFCIAGVVSFRAAKTTVNPLAPDSATALVCSGIYKTSRNPMYLGFALLLIAWTIYLSSPWTAFGVLGFMLYINRYQIAPEERALTELFGPEFISYQSKVRRWL